VARPRVLIFQTHAENSGTQEISRLLDLGLSKRGYDVFELFFVSTTSFLHSAPNVIVCALQPGRGVLYHIRMALLALSEIRRLRPDVILCMQWGGNMLSAFVAPFTGFPSIIANQFTAPTVPALARLIDRVLGTLGAFARVVVNSKTIEEIYSSYPKHYRKRLVRIEHGFKEKASNLSKAEARTTFGLPQGVPLLGSVGRLSTGKHFDAAIKLLSRNPDWLLALCGHGPEESKLRALATSQGCANRLILLGEIHPDRVGDFLTALDVFVFPSVAETFGLAAVEAAQAGIPVVANDLAVLREVLAVDDHPCALFVDANYTDSFSQAVSCLFSDEALCQRLTSAGRRLKARFPLEEMCDQYDRLIRVVLSEAR
jgi:glycosyltransferase involved in cell wall biosynthesis